MILLALMTAGCAAGPSYGFFDDRPWLGFMRCRGEPTAYLNTKIFGTHEENPTKAHEDKHVSQAYRFPSCRAFNTAYRRDRLTFEAEAYCAGAKVEEEQGRAMADTKLDYATRLSGGAYGKIDFKSAMAALDRYC